MAPKRNIAENLKTPKEGPTERISKSKKAGLTMPVSRFQRYLKKGKYSKRVSIGASVYMAAVIEYLVAEIAELAGNAAKANKKRTVNPRYIMLGIRNDEELNRLLEHVHIAGGGVIPQIHPALMSKKSGEEMTPQLKISQEF